MNVNKHQYTLIIFIFFIFSCINLFAQDSNGKHEFMKYVIAGDIEKLQNMIDSIDIEIESDNGNTALIYAAVYNRLEITKLLIERGANVNHYNDYNASPLNGALCRGNNEISKLLIINGADVNHCTEEGVTPLIFATNSTVEIVQLLLEHGANINAVNSDGISPLIMAIYNKRKDVVKILIENGADTYYKNKGGQTALVIAEILGYDEIAEVLRIYKN